MKTITITLPVSPDYHNESAELQKTEYTLTFDLQNGTHRGNHSCTGRKNNIS